ncbi:YghX family hydrolase [Maricaulaceae bacterium MS644]
MTRLTAKDFPPELLELYDFYAHDRISKRDFLVRASGYTVAGLTGAALIAAMSPDYALAQQVQFTDPDILPEYVTYPSPDGHGEVRAYRVAPAGLEAPVGGVVVVHENRGLNPYIEDVARRVAKAGFIALAPDGLTSVGGYPGNDDEGRTLQRSVDQEKLLNDFFAAKDHLQADPAVNGKVGCVGFCYGGGVCNAMAVAFPDLAASVPFYGRQASVEQVPAIQAPLLLHYAELDERINEGWPAYRDALDANNKAYTAHFYEGASHGFHNDSTPRFDEAAAALSWRRTLAFFQEHLV